MGSNRKFHRWQIAYKENKEKAQVKVISITPQVGRTGKITPVAELEPTQLSGATIYRATGHHFGLVKEQGLGAGSVVELTRSGMVIPKINKVLKKAEVDIPSDCPSCGSHLIWDSDFLMCPNIDSCPDQVIGKMIYFFKILANNDGFGQATIQKLYDHEIRKVSDIYELSLLNEEESHLSVYKGIVKCQNETIIKDLTISVINEKSFSNYDNYHPNDSTGHFVFVLQSGHNYNIEFKIDDLITYDTIRVPENEKGIQEYTKIVQISKEEISISDGVEVGKDIIDKLTYEKVYKQGYNINTPINEYTIFK